ncbi:hypothetical protein EDD70_0504 [Hydrogenoanaerobacterium saccharovorans]|uniref:Uncharacterized protein n=1 Tax=Hydrogenoanaerobacterium saccharovorans TaxID=474960 RepID=A0A1H8AZ21_9FIRM|nr:MobP3 family relaxase [Hydrogenoanaerobacterium saccharovorans]RPF47705.1 hypothetical protein EDD70_0504 [Hydrogenoanaerobacterium saccharovorans]SEM75139.1 hypothetical protein SAMN05216180_1587 [Hydrogenoanaerobacterium saccharovorans]
MASPKLICKSGYIQDISHTLNQLEYAGNKIAAQFIVYKDGGVLEVDSETRITLTDSALTNVAGIKLDYKDGGSKTVSYASYCKFTDESQESIRVHELQQVQDDSELLLNSDGKSYHKMEDLDFFKYLPYIAEREGVEKEDGHGLFGLTGNIDIEDAKAMALECEDSIKWSHIISLDTIAAKEAGFDHRAAWKNLIVSKAPQIAKAYNISLENLVMNCAYHDNTDNPHVHLLFYSKDKREGFIKGGKQGMQRASESLKSMFFNSIFKDEVKVREAEKHQQRSELKNELEQLLQNCYSKDYGHTELGDKLLNLADNLQVLDGKKQYGYLPKAVKTQVDDILHWVIENDADMQAMFNRYCELQKEFITGYVADPEVIEKKLEQFRQEFFHPDKDKLRIYHNTIVKCVVELNEQTTPPLNLERATEEKIFNSTPAEGIVSTESFEEIPFPNDEDAPPPMESEYHPPIFERAAEGEIFNFTPSELVVSTESFDGIPYPDDEGAPPPMELEYPPASERAAEGRNFDYPSGSPTKSSKDKEIREFLKNKKGCLNYKSFSQLYRKALDDIFNPKTTNTALQNFVLDEMQELNYLLTVEKTNKYSDGCKNHVRNVLSTIYHTDNDFRAGTDQLIHNTRKALIHKYDEEQVDKYLHQFEQNMWSLHRTNDAHDYIYYFAKTLDDQKYYQLLSAYREFNSPLNKAIYKVMDNLYENKEISELLKDIRYIKKEIAQYISNDEVSNLLCTDVQPVFSQLCHDAEFYDEFDTYKANYHQVFYENYDNQETAEKYCKRLDDNLLNVRRLMRPHYTVVQFAEHLDEYLYGKVARDKKINKPLHKALFNRLGSSLTDESNSVLAQFVRQELEQMHSDGNRQHTANILKMLYDTDENFRDILDAHTNTIYSQLKEKLGTAKALRLIEQHKQNLFSADSRLPINFLISNYAKNLSESYYQQITYENRNVFSDVNGIVSTRLRNCWENPQIVDAAFILHQLMDADDTNAAEIEEATTNLFKLIYDKPLEEELEKAVTQMTAKFKEHCSDPNMVLEMEERLYSAIYLGDSSSPVNYRIQSFCKNIKEEYCRKVAKDKEINKPLHKVLFRCLGSSLTDESNSILAQFVRQELELMHIDGNSQHAVDILKMLYDTSIEFKDALDTHTNTIYAQLKEKFGTEDALRLIKQHKQNIFSADSKLPVNFLISKYSENLSESYYQQITHEYRNVFACVNQTISKRLRNCWHNKKIVEAAYELNQLFNTEETNAVEIEKATTKLFKLIYDKPLEDELEKAITQMAAKFKEHCSDPNMVLELEERLRSDIYLGDSSSSVNFIIQSFGKNVKEEHAKAILREMPELKEYRSQLYRHLSGALVTGNQQILQLFSAYQMDARGIAQLDEILKMLSCKDFDFVAEKEKLYQSFLSQLQKQGVPRPAGEYQQIFENLFYRKENNKYDTMHIREVVEDVIQNKAEILHRYRTMRCCQLAKALFHDLARILNGQSQNMNRYAEHNQRASFKAQKQFKNRKQFVAQTFDHDDAISY